MRCYHRTTEEGANAILSGGFEDAAGSSATEHSYQGVWVSDVPLDADDGAAGDTLISVDVPEKVFGEYEWVEADPQIRGKQGHREALIPAAQLNKARVVIVED